jgi:hypothetical protein
MREFLFSDKERAAHRRLGGDGYAAAGAFGCPRRSSLRSRDASVAGSYADLLRRSSESKGERSEPRGEDSPKGYHNPAA